MRKIKGEEHKVQKCNFLEFFLAYLVNTCKKKNERTKNSSLTMLKFSHHCHKYVTYHTDFYIPLYSGIQASQTQLQNNP